ncbi:MAG: TIM barrel protein, partial [Bacteroidales bacterium]|nr:TIM barrel protein [Bacteroidales bacterium]
SHQECIDWWKEAVDAHAAAGCIAIVAPGMGYEAFQSPAGLQAYCDLYNEVGEMCAAKGMKFGYHNHHSEFTTLFVLQDGSRISVYDYMLQNTDPEKVFFQLDLYWCWRAGENPVEVIKANPGRFFLWHVKDEVEVGASGQIDFPEIYKYAKLSGMKYQIVEQEAYAEGADPFESVKVSCDYVKTMRPQ